MGLVIRIKLMSEVASIRPPHASGLPIGSQEDPILNESEAKENAKGRVRVVMGLVLGGVFAAAAAAAGHGELVIPGAIAGTMMGTSAGEKVAGKVEDAYDSAKTGVTSMVGRAEKWSEN